MKAFLTLYKIELIKLKRTLALWMAVLAPAVVLMFQIVSWLRNVDSFKDGLDPWMIFHENVGAMWGIFMLPLFTALITALIYQLDFANNGWLRLYTMPIRRWVIPTAKIAVVMTVILLATAVMTVGSLFGVLFVDLVKPALVIDEPVPYLALLKVSSILFVSSLSMIAIQNIISFRFSAISVPLGVGIGGVFVAIFAASAKYGYLFPWLMPIRAIRGAEEFVPTIIILNVVGGLLLFSTLIFYATKRDPGLIR
ncbi:MAG: ABC transporter permease [candidate division Zixibacteria bacterium]